MWKLVFAIAVGTGPVVAVGCKSNPSYCQGGPASCGDLDATAPPRCERSADCEVAAPICDLADGACVECTPDQLDRCTGTTPVCGADRTCQPCRAHTDCASAACAPDGSCARETDVAYVSESGTDNDTCTRGEPCARVAAALATGRPTIKIRGLIVEPVVLTDRNATLLAEPGARLTRATAGIVLEIRGTSIVAVEGLEIAFAKEPGGIGISIPAGSDPRVLLSRVRVVANEGTGLVAAGGVIVVRRSELIGNRGGGISLSNGVQFDLENNVIAKNGNLESSSFGGLWIAQVNDGKRRLEFNTITMNSGPPGAHTGVLCAGILKPVTFSSNIIYGNVVSGDGEQVAGTRCYYRYSDIGPNSVPGAGNRSIDPRFVDAAHDDFHLAPDSPLIDAADLNTTLEIDVDGEERPQGRRRDIGADERAP